jgi:hypothetical protein
MNEYFIYRPKIYPGPIAIDMKPSKELIEYHENSSIQINMEGKTIIKKVKDI